MEEQLQRQIEQIQHLYSVGERETALELCNQVLLHSPENIDAMGYRTALLRELNMTDEAVMAFQQLAETHAQQGNYLKALATAREFKAIQPDASEVTTQKLAEWYSKSPTSQEEMFKDATNPMLRRYEANDELVQQLIDQLKADTITIDETEYHASNQFETSQPVFLEPQESGTSSTDHFSNQSMDDGETVFQPPGSFKHILEQTTPDAHLPLPPLFNDLDKESMAAIWKQMESVHLPAGTTLIRQGDEGEIFYIIVEGAVRILYTFEGSTEDLGHLGPGQFFGEISLLTSQKRTATVETVSDCHFLQLRRSDLQQIVQQYPQVNYELQRFVQQRLIQKLLLTSLLFFPLNDVKRWELAQQFNVVEVPPATTLITEGEPADALYIIAGGAVDVYKTNLDGVVQHLERLGTGQFFGEISLLHEQPSMCSIVSEQAATVLKLQAQDFSNVMRDYPRVLDLLKVVALRRVEQMDALDPRVNEFTHWPTNF